MTNHTKVFSNVALVAMVAMLFTGCALLPAKNQDAMDAPVTVDDASYTELSDDDSLDTIEAEIDATIIEDEDFSILESELSGSEDVMMQK